MARPDLALERSDLERDCDSGRGREGADLDGRHVGSGLQPAAGSGRRDGRWKESDGEGQLGRRWDPDLRFPDDGKPVSDLAANLGGHGRGFRPPMAGSAGGGGRLHRRKYLTDLGEGEEIGTCWGGDGQSPEGGLAIWPGWGCWAKGVAEGMGGGLAAGCGGCWVAAGWVVCGLGLGCLLGGYGLGLGWLRGGYMVVAGWLRGGCWAGWVEELGWVRWLEWLG
uniref:Uncharacterized protein n=1 Tax=Kalanchoe fedtschenkoi TaxID=63787 RepID=A0A7N0TV92_KALFE